MHYQDLVFALSFSGAFAAPAALKVTRDTCSDACGAAYNTCRSDPGNNRSLCASNYSTCLGYSPFDSAGSLVTPTACSITTSATSTTAAASSTASGNACVNACNAAYNTCRSNTSNGRATCASEYSSCLGYVPFDNSGSLVTPTACSITTSATATTTTAAASSTASGNACVNACNAAYNTCRSDPGNNRSTCASNYSSCLGYSPFDNSGSLVTPTACSITTSTTAAPVASSTASGNACVNACDAAYNTCRSNTANNRATCASDYSSCLGYSPFDASGSLVPPTACSITTSAASTAPATSAPAATTSIAGIPGGCNPAHPGSCPSSYFSTITTVTATATNAPSSTITQIVPATNTASPDQTSVVEGAGWTVKNLSRYCGEGNTGCDYNFVLSTNDERPDEACTVIRNPGKDASTESWYAVPCTTGSVVSVSWGFSDQFGAGNEFAVLTITNNQEKANAYFGVANVNSQPITAGNPAGSGQYGDIGPQPVYTF